MRYKTVMLGSIKEKICYNVQFDSWLYFMRVPYFVKAPFKMCEPSNLVYVDIFLYD